MKRRVLFLLIGTGLLILAVVLNYAVTDNPGSLHNSIPFLAPSVYDIFKLGGIIFLIFGFWAGSENAKLKPPLRFLFTGIGLIVITVSVFFIAMNNPQSTAPIPGGIIRTIYDIVKTGGFLFTIFGVVLMLSNHNRVDESKH